MDELLSFFLTKSLSLTAIAIAGVVILAILKYCGAFKMLEEKQRHYVYLAISVCFSIVGTSIYLHLSNAFTVEYILAISSATYALNQTCYNIFKVTPVNKLIDSAIKIVLDFINKRSR